MIATLGATRSHLASMAGHPQGAMTHPVLMRGKHIGNGMTSMTIIMTHSICTVAVIGLAVIGLVVIGLAVAKRKATVVLSRAGVVVSQATGRPIARTATDRKES